ncbi:MAG: ABC transporter permease [Phycisphaerales bacterium]|nr:ABC transporter permease [Phycisphaerales bacterium]
MFYLRLVMTSLRSLDSHFLRSLLATLGVLIGVSSVVAAMSILEGASKDIFSRFRSLGANVLFVFPEQVQVGGQSAGMAQTLQMSDIDHLLRELGEDLDRVAPEAIGAATVRYFQKTEEATVLATSAAYFEIHEYKPQTGGRIFAPSEVTNPDATVALLGSKVAEKLFGGADAVGQTIRVGNVSYRIIGVMERRGSLGFLNADQTVFIPIEAGLRRFFNRPWLNRLTIAVSDSERLAEMQKNVQRSLRRSHGIRPGQADDFRILNQEEALQNITQVMLILRVVFYSIAGISLLVGGIGIMNIMLVSVTERTREIGVRMAVGARRSDILLQFLIEALVISLLGGGLGLLLGWMFADIMQSVLKLLDFKTEVNSTVIIASLATATIVGVVSGLYPAFKASRLDPVDALRHE